MHADYASSRHTVVNIYWDYYDFTNAGQMLIPEEDFFTTLESSYRNPIISKFMVNIGLGERGGTGGGQIYAVANNDVLRAPEITTSIAETKLRIWTIDYVQSIPDLTDQEQLVLSILFKANVPLKRTEIIELTNLTPYYTDKVLESLLEDNLIASSGTFRNRRYEFKRSQVQQIARIKQQSADLRFPNTD